MKTCETCKHWDNDSKWGKCDAILSDDGLYGKEGGGIAYTVHGGWWDVPLRTHKSFGCVLHERKTDE